MTLATTARQAPGERVILSADLLAEIGREKSVDIRLRRLLQVAVQVEFATIPPYLTALYSMVDKRSPAYHLVRSVAMEEMVHLNLASNLLNAVGGVPTLVPPRYPCHLSKEASGQGPFLQLMPASKQLFRETFMRIEQPAEPFAPPVGEQFPTIAQLYAKIRDLFEEYTGDYDPTNQTGDGWNFANNGGSVITVADRTTARQAVNEIMEQGEGAAVVTDEDRQKYQISQPWGQYEYYGPRTDGTYGPVLGTPLEMSHYFKFRSIADGVTPLPEVRPMMPNPSADKYVNPLAVRLSRLFDHLYTFLVNSLENALRSADEQPRYFSEVVPMMRVGLPVVATQLMTTQADDTTRHTGVDPTAGPAFNYLPADEIRVDPAVSVQLDEIIAAVRDGTLTGGSASLVPALLKVRGNLPAALTGSGGS